VNSWRTIDGIDWLCPDHPAIPDAPTELGVVFDHGYAHEAPADLGIGAVAAAMLARELGRPRETADHRIVEPEVTARVSLQDTVIVMRGDTDAVRLGALALDQLLQDPTPLGRARLPNVRRFGWDGWTNELTAWFGMGPVALAAELDSPWDGDRRQLQELVHRPDPAQGTSAIAWTTLAAQPGRSPVHLAHDPAGRRTTMTTPDRHTTRYGWDAADRLAWIDHQLLGRAGSTGTWPDGWSRRPSTASSNPGNTTTGSLSPHPHLRRRRATRTVIGRDPEGRITRISRDDHGVMVR
jgi:YD repeat-containing protein